MKTINLTSNTHTAEVLNVTELDGMNMMFAFLHVYEEKFYAIYNCLKKDNSYRQIAIRIHSLT